MRNKTIFGKTVNVGNNSGFFSTL